MEHLPRRKPAWVSTFLWWMSYSLGCLLGLQTIAAPTGLALFWPASGIGVAWLILRRPGTAGWAAFAMGSTIVGLGLVSGAATLRVLIIFAAAQLCLCFLAAYVFNRARNEDPEHNAFGLTTRSYTMLLVGAALGAAASMPLAMLAAQLDVGRFAPSLSVAWLVRNTMSVLIVSSAICLIPRGPGAWRRLVPGRQGITIASVVLAVGLAAFVAELSPLVTFAVMGVMVWAGAQLPPYGVAWLNVAVSVLIIEASVLTDHGPFSSILDPMAQAVTQQLFLGTISLVSLTLSLVASERSSLQDSLASSRRLDVYLAEFLRTVSTAMDEDVFALNDGGEVIWRNHERAQLPLMENLHDLSGVHLGLNNIGQLLVHADASLVQVASHEGATRRVIEVQPSTMVGPDADTVTVLVLRDVTEAQERFDQLQSFAGSVAHDLTNPLSTVVGFTHMAEYELTRLPLTEADKAGVAQMLERIEAGARRMNNLVNDLLDLSLADSKHLRQETADLVEILAEVSEELTESSPACSIEVSGEVGRAFVDSVMVRQLFANLLRNSVKYTPVDRAPRIEVRLRQDVDRLHVEVDDDGIGIPEGEHASVFTPFFRATNRGEAPGTGLGLAICLRAVRRHGGTITAHANPRGRGTIVRFDLPADCAVIEKSVADEVSLRAQIQSANP